MTTAPAAYAAPSPDPVAASGTNWSVNAAPGGYLVTLELDEPLPIVSDAPTLIVDGAPIGLATESEDGLSLTVLTTDPAVAAASSVEKGWASGDTAKAAEVDGEQQAPGARSFSRQLRALAEPTVAEEPSAPGEFTVTEAEYDFGDRAVPLAAIGGVRGEVTGKMYLTSAAGERPTVILLHGRHSSCGGTGANPLRWPCGPTQSNIRSYLGYEGTGRALASHGYNVLSIAANAVNSNDNQFAPDRGAQARGRLILDTLDMLEKANAGEAVTFDDISWPDAEGQVTSVTRTLDEALALAVTRADQPAPAAGVTAASLRGRFDLDRVGLMGHSRGGEGVVSAATLNQAEEEPYGIESVLPLAPVDFGRMTLPDVPMAVFLPYCDGDVSNQQGQHMIDDSRFAFRDDALRSSVWIMGTNHNFFNTVWTPGLYPFGASDDWTTRDLTSTCSTLSPTRLSASDQYQVGVSYMTGFFRLTMGGETQFQPMFDGSVKPSTPATEFADVRIMATQPESTRMLINEMATTSSLVRAAGNGTASVCMNMSGRTLPQALPFCTTNRASSQVPHWTPATYGPNVPALPVTRFLWTPTEPTAVSTGELRVSVPASQRNVSAMSQLTVKTAPDESLTDATDFAITVLDGSGGSFRALASEINPLAVSRMPGGEARLDKIVLQQLTIPTASMTGVNLTDVREIRFSAVAPGAGGVYLSDLAFDTPSVGTAQIRTRTTVNVANTTVEEGNGPGTADVAVYLNRPETLPVTAYFTALGSNTAAVGLGMERVVFQPGETCKIVTVPTLGNDAASAAPFSTFQVSVTNSSNAVMGDAAFANVLVREDDGVTGDVIELPPVGAQGDVCAEFEALLAPVPLTVSADDVAPGESFTATAEGFRAGEAVVFGFGEELLDTVIANADGVATLEVTVSEDAALGATAVSALGGGSGRIATAEVSVLAPTETVLTVTPDEPVAGASLTLTATVSGADTTGTVTFTTGEPMGVLAADVTAAAVLGEEPVVDGQAVLALPEGLPEGSHTLVATFGRTDTASASSDTVTIVVAAAPETPGDGDGETPGDGGQIPGNGGETPGTGGETPGTGGETPGTGGDAFDGGSWQPAPSGGAPLAATGADLATWVPIAGLVLLVGGLALVVKRRRSIES